MIRMNFRIAFLLFAFSLQATAFINGRLINPGEFPSSFWIGEGCTGSLVAPHKLLIAAHCVTSYKDTYFHQIGQRINLYTSPEALGSTPTAAIIEDVIVHPDWLKKMDSGVLMEDFMQLDDSADLAVLVVKEDLTDISSLKVANVSYTALKLNQKVIVGGYGCESEDTETREPKYKVATKMINALKGNLFNATEQNAEDHSTSMGCPGDSGGPVYTMKKNKQYVIGVNSSVNGNELVGRLTMVNLGKHKAWLKKVLTDSKAN